MAPNNGLGSVFSIVSLFLFISPQIYFTAPLTPEVDRFSPTPANPPTLLPPAGCPIIQLSSETTWHHRRPHRVGKGSAHQTAPLQRPIASPGPPVLPTSRLSARGFHKPFLGPIICQNGSQNSGRWLTYHHQFITKDTALEHPNGRDARGTAWGKGHRAFKVLSGQTTLPAPPCGHQPRMSPKPVMLVRCGGSIT